MTQAPEIQIMTLLSMCVCSVVASLTGEMAARNFAYHTHRTADSDKSCCYPWFVCHDKNITSAMHARSGSPLMINHLTTVIRFFFVW